MRSAARNAGLAPTSLRVLRKSLRWVWPGALLTRMRERLHAIQADEVRSFKDRAEFDAAQGGCPDLSADGSVFEVDVESDRGGPARRFIFGGQAAGYRLHCVSRP